MKAVFRRRILFAAVTVLLALGPEMSLSQTHRSAAEPWQVKGIQAALTDSLPAVRVEAVPQIEKFQKIDGLPSSEISPLLESDDEEIRAKAARALAVLGAKDQIPKLEILRQDPVTFVRITAVEAIAKLQGKDEPYAEYFELLRKAGALSGDTPAAVVSVSQAKEQGAALVRLLTNPSDKLRFAAALALGEMHANDRAPEVAKLLRDRNGGVRMMAIRVLGDLQATDRAAELVRVLRDDPNETTRFEAAWALGKMKAHDQASEIADIIKGPNAKARRTAVTALGEIQAKEYAPLLLELIKNSQREDILAWDSAEALGAMGAREQIPELVKLLKDPSGHKPIAAIIALGRLKATDQATELVPFLKDPSDVTRAHAAQALGEMQARNQAPDLIKLIGDSEYSVSTAAELALTSMGPLDTKTVLPMAALYYEDHSKQDHVRFLLYYLSGGDPRIVKLLRRVMYGEDQKPVPIATATDAREDLEAIRDLMSSTRLPKALATDTDEQIIQITREWKGTRTETDNTLLENLANQMDPDRAQVLRGLITIPWWKPVLRKTWKIVLVQAFLWVLLIYFYPRSPWIQALFFWNRWVRKVFGLAYVDFCLTFVPFLRGRLLGPFKDELLADAKVHDPALDNYFAGVEVRERGLEGKIPINDALPSIQGQTVLEGDSGLGKSTFLRQLVKEHKSPIVYLPASSCDQGVFEAIQARLQGKASDEIFLKTIIWSGGLSIVIDGLNEVTVETRETIQRFLRDFPKAHILLASQPLLWKRPPRARVFSMLPLDEDKIRRFLESRYEVLGNRKIDREEFVRRCLEYLDDVTSSSRPDEDLQEVLSVLSNPMDLSTAAMILMNGERPTLSGLQDQQYRQMAAEYETNHPGEEVPLLKFSERVYEARLQDDVALPPEFFPLIQEMVLQKMALEQNGIDAEDKPTKKWIFRHDKIRDYFLMQAFLANQERVPLHVDDPRFRGVYLMLASRLPLNQALILREIIVDRAADTKDHHLSDAVVHILKTRRSSSRATVDLSASA